MNSKLNAAMSLAWDGANQELTDNSESVRACLAALGPTGVRGGG